MDSINLKAKNRTQDKKNNEKLRQDGKIPAVIYGPNSKNKKLLIGYKDFLDVLKEAGQSTLVDLVVEDNNPVKVLIQDVAVDPVSDRFIHVDFYQLDMNKKLKVEIELNFVGEAPAVKDRGGELIKAMDKIEVECLPKDLVKEIDVDVSILNNIGDQILVKELALPSGIELETDPDLMIVGAEEIREEIIEEPKEEEKEATEEAEEAKEGEGKEQSSQDDKKEEGSKPVEEKEGKKG